MFLIFIYNNIKKFIVIIIDLLLKEKEYSVIY
jgi:hypothetical protein